MGDGLFLSVVLKIVFQVPGQLLFGLMVLVDILLQPQAQDGLVERYHGQQVRDVLAGVAPGIGSKALVEVSAARRYSCSASGEEAVRLNMRPAIFTLIFWSITLPPSRRCIYQSP